MKKLALIIASLMTAGSAMAAEQFNDKARVLNVRPIQERIPVSREECWNDTQRGYEERRVTRSDTGASIGAGTVLGAIVGGVLGHQVGGGRGKDAATAGGAVVGGLIGNQSDRNSRGDSYTEIERVPVDRTVERCRTINEVREATMGYDVEYEYSGRRFMSRMDRDPGRDLRVRVDVQPIEGNELPQGRPGRGPGAPVYRP